MCGRYDLHERPQMIAEHFGARTGEPYTPNFQFWPGTRIPVIRVRNGERVLERFHWGFVPAWAKPDALKGETGKKLPTPINARAEVLTSNGLYRSAAKTTRCLIPMNGFYEPDQRSRRRPYPQRYYRSVNGELLAVAGIYAHWAASPDNPDYLSTAIITVDANATVREGGHHRMPALLQGDAVSTWLDPNVHDAEAIEASLRPAPDHMLESWQVDHRRLNARTADGSWYGEPDLFEPVTPHDTEK